MTSHFNRRGHNLVFKGLHLKLKDLRKKAEEEGWKNRYLFKDHIPAYPRPEFHVSHLKHDTDQAGLRGIRRDGGFRNPADGSLLWWSLVVGSDEIRSAERRLLETTYPDRTEEQAQKQQSFLEKFATSPAFMKSSRLGSYRFTFPLEEVLKAYRDQFCSGAQPVMRVFRTILYKQEVMYAVLVHSPANQQLFSDLPLLTDDPNSVCTYRDGHFIWRSEAMCETHRYKLVHRQYEEQMVVREACKPHQFYVWDNVGVVLHVDRQVLQFDAGRLRENLTFCDKGPVTVKGSPHDPFVGAAEIVKELWPNCLSPLKRAVCLSFYTFI
ncbi:uncharacterized protein LOC127360488 isoform X1 [Dicentrarchus labrax]|uniref:uncharacterized protein LOC127360488 isoform X1 n=1 Tax=Dicentrarchus labrax TaxID=13489 RepID=UPI0021F561EF|nr:uncharacterized protein LOC127360488 isoform X1 [Dicentrarchus labrax]